MCYKCIVLLSSWNIPTVRFCPWYDSVLLLIVVTNFIQIDMKNVNPSDPHISSLINDVNVSTCALNLILNEPSQVEVWTCTVRSLNKFGHFRGRDPVMGRGRVLRPCTEGGGWGLVQWGLETLQPCSHMTKFSPILWLKISVRYSVNNGFVTHSAWNSARHHWHNGKQ